jgi:hypothetical protein
MEVATQLQQLLTANQHIERFALVVGHFGVAVAADAAKSTTFPGARATQMVQSGVPNDSRQPRSKTSAGIERVQLSVSLGEGVLHNILGEVRITHHAQSQ